MTSVRHVGQQDAASWLRLRHALWPDASQVEHHTGIQAFLAGLAREPLALLVAGDGRSTALVGFAEPSIRA